MILPYLDASALAKRYFPERGSAVVGHLFRRVPPDRMAMLAVCPAEVVSILVRRRNARRMTPTEFRQAVRAVRTDVGLYTPVHHLDVTRDIADQAFDLIDRHSINSTDAILLRTALDLAASLRAHQNDLVLITCDQRLIRAARAEGLDTFNPETQSEAEFDALLGP